MELIKIFVSNSHQDEEFKDEAYEKGFYFKNDYYDSVNYAFLLNVRGNFVSIPAEAITDYVLARRVRQVVLAICEQWLQQNLAPKIQGDNPGVMTTYLNNRYWVLATQGEAYLGLGEEEKAKEKLQEAYAGGAESWMQQSTEYQLSKLKPLLENSPLKFLKPNNTKKGM